MGEILAVEKIKKAMNSLQNALDNYEQGETRKALTDLDYAKDYNFAAIHLTIAEIEEAEKDGK